MVAAIRRLGVDAVFNMDVTADLTIMEEATELVERIKKKVTYDIRREIINWINNIFSFKTIFINSIVKSKFLKLFPIQRKKWFSSLLRVFVQPLEKVLECQLVQT